MYGIGVMDIPGHSVFGGANLHPDSHHTHTHTYYMMKRENKRKEEEEMGRQTDPQDTWYLPMPSMVWRKIAMMDKKKSWLHKTQDSVVCDSKALQWDKSMTFTQHTRLREQRQTGLT